MMEKDKKVNIGFIGYIILVFVLLISALLVSILIGEAKISFSTIMDAIFHYNPKNQQHNILTNNIMLLIFRIIMKNSIHNS